MSRGSVWVSRRCCQALTRKPQVPAAGSLMRSPGRGSRILTNHADDVTRRAKLAILTGGVELAEDVFVEVALHVLVLGRDLHGVGGVTGLDEQAGLVNLELSFFHLGRETA